MHDKETAQEGAQACREESGEVQGRSLAEIATSPWIAASLIANRRLKPATTRTQIDLKLPR